jgi:hypothetical protein
MLSANCVRAPSVLCEINDQSPEQSTSNGEQPAWPHRGLQLQLERVRAASSAHVHPLSPTDPHLQEPRPAVPFIPEIVTRALRLTPALHQLDKHFRASYESFRAARPTVRVKKAMHLSDRRCIQDMVRRDNLHNPGLNLAVINNPADLHMAVGLQDVAFHTRLIFADSGHNVHHQIFADIQATPGLPLSAILINPKPERITVSSEATVFKQFSAALACFKPRISVVHADVQNNPYEGFMHCRVFAFKSYRAVELFARLHADQCQPLNPDTATSGVRHPESRDIRRLPASVLETHFFEHGYPGSVTYAAHCAVLAPDTGNQGSSCSKRKLLMGELPEGGISSHEKTIDLERLKALAELRLAYVQDATSAVAPLAQPATDSGQTAPFTDSEISPAAWDTDQFSASMFNEFCREDMNQFAEFKFNEFCRQDIDQLEAFVSNEPEQDWTKIELQDWMGI